MFEGSNTHCILCSTQVISMRAGGVQQRPAGTERHVSQPHPRPRARLFCRQVRVQVWWLRIPRGSIGMPHPDERMQAADPPTRPDRLGVCAPRTRVCLAVGVTQSTPTAATTAPTATEGLILGRGSEGAWDAGAVGHPVVSGWVLGARGGVALPDPTLPHSQRRPAVARAQRPDTCQNHTYRCRAGALLHRGQRAALVHVVQRRRPAAHQPGGRGARIRERG